MSDIFISYASEDRQRARILAQALEQLGWSVWWDRTIPAGRTFAEVIEEALANARCVMVLWSRVSIKKGWVREEADEGKKRNILIPVLIDQVDPPFGFRSIQAADLIEWQGAVDAPGFKGLVKDTARIIGEPPTSINEVVAKSEEKIRQKTQEEQKRAEEAARKAVAERKRVEEEKRRAEEEAKRKATEENRKAETAARLKAEQEARLRKEEEQRKTAAETERKRVEEEKRKAAEEEKRRAEAAARRNAQEMPKKHRLAVPAWLIVIVVCILLIAVYAVYLYRQKHLELSRTVESKREIAQEPVWKEPFTEMEFVLVPGGCYDMGDTFGDGDSDEKPVHRVCVDDFYLGRNETTVGQFKRFVSETGYRTGAEKGDGCYFWTGSKWEFKKESNWKNPGFPQSDNHPVVCVSWRDAQEFTQWLSKKSGKDLRLSTEAEWEYAARSGGRSEKWAGTSTASNLRNFAWFSENSGSKTQPVGELSPNGLGLYDMSGNVLEWVNDWYDEKYYSKSPEQNPQGPTSGTYRVLRGGSWSFNPEIVRCAFRLRYNPGDWGSDIGFRCARTKK